MALPNLRSTLSCLALSLVLCTTHTIPPAEGRDLHMLRERNVTMVKGDLPSAVDWAEGRDLHMLPRQNVSTRRRSRTICPLKWTGGNGVSSCRHWTNKAAATAAFIEGLYRIKTGRSLRLSAQELVDCDKTNNGCNKGSPRAAFSWIVKNGGIATNSDYPFVARQDQCNEQKLGIHAVTITGYVAVGKTEADLMTAVAAQPVVAGLALAKDDAYKNYRGGVFEGPCGDYKHAVTVVGYGTSDKGVPYWIVKNSYGTSWGEKGYMYIRRGVQQPGGLCGIAEKASYPYVVH